MDNEHVVHPQRTGWSRAIRLLKWLGIIAIGGLVALVGAVVAVEWIVPHEALVATIEYVTTEVFPLNHIEVRCNDRPAEDVKVEWLDTSDNGSRRVVWDSGRAIAPIPGRYGENDFVVTYRDVERCRFRDFKTNWRERRRYLFYCHTLDDDLTCNVAFIGSDGWFDILSGQHLCKPDRAKK